MTRTRWECCTLIREYLPRQVCLEGSMLLVMKGAARARLGDARWPPSEHTLNLTQPEKRRRLAVLLEQRRRRRRLGHDLLDAAGRPPPRHAEEEERREEVEAEAEGDAPKMPALL